MTLVLLTLVNIINLGRQMGGNCRQLLVFIFIVLLIYYYITIYL